MSALPGWKDKVLFTPGPLTTSRTVKQAMLTDLGSRDGAFVATVREIRSRLLAIAGANPDRYTAVIIQGSGTFGIEAMIGSAIPPEGKLLVLVNGAYGRRMAQMARVLRIPVSVIETPEDQSPSPEQVRATLAADPQITHVAVVHCETTTGILNPVTEIGSVVAAAGKVYLVDAMSSFGAIALDLAAAHVDYLVSSANKCIEGVPGFSFVLARTAHLLTTGGWARSLSLDLLAQYQGLEETGQFRFTPPTHALLAFHRALQELADEGGVPGRLARYQANHSRLLAGMRAMGFVPFLPPERQGPVITSFYYPDHPAFSFESFYARLNDRGYVVYPGKLSHADCFRIGSIGRIFLSDVDDLLAAIGAVLAEMGVPLPSSTPAPVCAPA